MNSALPLGSTILVQWTWLLTLGWLGHGLIRRRHPRGRLLLWRSILLIGLALPVLSLLPLPRLRVATPLLSTRDSNAGLRARLGLVPNSAIATSRNTSTGEKPPSSAEATGVSRSASLASAEIPSPAQPLAIPADAPSLSWFSVLAGIWLVGCLGESLRLLRLHLRLRRIVRRATPAGPSIQEAADLIQARLRINRPVAVRLSDDITAPCLCGIVQPVILLPRALASDLPSDELQALLSHEFAHRQRHDLAWSVSWRAMRAVWWWHPLVWAVPAAHVLACEEEADRIAAGQPRAEGDYAQLLARLALRVVQTPTAGSPLALSATSHLAQRLRRLARSGPAGWRRQDSLTGLAGAIVLLAATAGWQFAAEPEKAATAAALPTIETATVVVTVQDDQGNSIAGATIKREGLRAKSEALRGNYYIWNPARHGPAEAVTTDREGRATLTYPMMVRAEEKVATGELTLVVSHREFAAIRAERFLVDGPQPPVRLKRGTPLHLTAYYGSEREPVTKLVPILLTERQAVRPEWTRDEAGRLSWGGAAPGKHFLFVAGRRASGEIVFGEGTAFFSEQRNEHDFAVELKPGIRIEGRLADSAPRPVKNGWVQLSVHDDEADTRDDRLRRSLPNGGHTGFWFTYRPIKADGTFVFESVPPGTIKVIAYGEGFVSLNAEEPPAQPQYAKSGATPPRRTTRGVPQTFATTRPVTKIEIPTVATATINAVVREGGAPVSGAKVYVWPNMIQMPFGSGLFAAARKADDAAFVTLPPLPPPSFTAVTGADGAVVLANIPAFTPTLALEHPLFEIPLQQPGKGASEFASPTRYLPLSLAPGKTSVVEVTVQPKGREFIGQAR